MSRELAELDLRLSQLGIDTAQLVERFVRAGGPGGQHVNKTSTAVQLSYPPTNLEVRADGERSQLQNRIAARELLIARVESQRAIEAAEKQQAREKERRRRRRPSPAARRRNVEAKRRRGVAKRLRGKVRGDD
jgi:protein subunit release factor B